MGPVESGAARGRCAASVPDPQPSRPSFVPPSQLRLSGLIDR